MARIRTHKPEYYTDEKINELSIPARYVFQGLWCHCDDQGYCTLTDFELRMALVPTDDVDMRGLLAEIVHQGMLQEFQTEEGKRVLKVTNFNRHQKVDRPSKPRFEPHDLTASRGLAEHSSSPRGNGNSMSARRAAREPSSSPRRALDELPPDQPIRRALDGNSVGSSPERKGKELKTPSGHPGEVTSDRATRASEPPTSMSHSAVMAWRAVDIERTPDGRYRAALTLLVASTGCSDEEAEVIAEDLVKSEQPRDLPQFIRGVVEAGGEGKWLTRARKHLATPNPHAHPVVAWDGSANGVSPQLARGVEPNQEYREAKARLKPGIPLRDRTKAPHKTEAKERLRAATPEVDFPSTEPEA